MRRSRGYLRAVNLDRQCQGGATKGFWLALIWILLHFHEIQVGRAGRKRVGWRGVLEVDLSSGSSRRIGWKEPRRAWNINGTAPNLKTTWQCDMKVQDLKDMPRRNEELNNLEADMPRLLEKAAKSCKAKTGVVCDGFHPKVPLDLTKETRGKMVEFLEKVLQCGRWPQQACTKMFFLKSKNVTTERPIALMSAMVRWWEALRAPEVAKWQHKCRFEWDPTDGRNGGVERTVWETLDGKIHLPCRWKRSRSDSTGAWLFESLRASQLVWAWARHVHFPKNKTRVLCWYFEHQRRVQFEGCVTATLPGSKSSYLLLRVVSQDALSKVTKIFPPEIEGVCGWQLSWKEETRSRWSWQKGSDEIEKGRRKGPESVDHWTRKKERARQSPPASIWKRGFSNAARGKELFWQGVWKRWEWTRERESNCSGQRRRRE